jgi:hypothetical protein
MRCLFEVQKVISNSKSESKEEVRVKKTGYIFIPIPVQKVLKAIILGMGMCLSLRELKATQKYTGSSFL